MCDSSQPDDCEGNYSIEDNEIGQLDPTIDYTPRQEAGIFAFRDYDSILVEKGV